MRLPWIHIQLTEWYGTFPFPLELLGSPYKVKFILYNVCLNGACIQLCSCFALSIIIIRAMLTDRDPLIASASVSVAGILVRKNKKNHSTTIILSFMKTDRVFSCRLDLFQKSLMSGDLYQTWIASEFFIGVAVTTWCWCREAYHSWREMEWRGL